MSKASFLDAEHARLTKRAAPFSALASIGFPIGLEKDLLADCPPYVERLAYGCIRVCLTESQLAEEDDIEVAIVEALLVKRLVFL